MSQYKRSNVWAYFEKIKEGGKCKYCNIVVRTSGNTTNLQNHLKRRHPTIKIVEKKRSDGLVKKNFFEISLESSDIENAVESPLPNKKRTIDSNKIEYVSQKTKQSSLFECVTKIESLQDGGWMAGQIKNAILYMIVMDDLPLSTVEKKGFLHLMKTVSPQYKVPGRFAISSLVETKYEIISQKVKEKIKEAIAISLTTDGWTDPLNTKSYLGVTCHFIDITSKKLCSYIIAVEDLDESHTSEYLGETLKNICSRWGIDNVICVTTDNAANIVNAVKNTFGEDKHLSCFAHSINLVANKPYHEKKRHS